MTAHSHDPSDPSRRAQAKPDRALKLWNDTLQVVELAKELGHVALALREAGLEVESKSDGSDVTNADLEIHKRALEALPLIRSLYVESEESQCKHGAPTAQAQTQWWLIDPIDGTATYKGGYDGFCICLSLIENERPIVGVVAAPARDAVYYAAHGLGAFKQTLSTGSQVRLSAERSQKGPFRFGGYYSYSSEQQAVLDAFLEKNDLPSSCVEPVAAALKYCLVAEGELDMAGGWRPMSTWDVSAVDLIVHEAHGSFIDFQTGNLFRYKPGEPLVNAPMALGRDVRVKW